MKDREDLLAAAKGILNRGEATPLRVVPPADDTGEPTQPMEVVPAAPAPLAGRQMGFLDQARHQAGYTWLQVRQARHTEGGIIHRLYHGQPRSMAMHADYVRNRRWVKPGHEGGVADKGGVAYHMTIGNPLVAVGNTVTAVGESPLKFGIAYLAGVLPLTELALIGFHHTTLAVWIAVIHVAVIAAVVLTLCTVTGRRDEAPVAEVITEDEEPAS